MFLNYILNCKKDETIVKVFRAQENDPLPNDWSCTVKEDLKSLGLNYTVDELGLIKKVNLKRLVKEACRKTAFTFLTSEIKRKNMTKLQNIQYTKLEMQDYLKSQKINLQKKENFI